MNLVWSEADVTADDPLKINLPDGEIVSEPIRRMIDLTRNAQDEFIIISSYLVPKDEGVEWVKDLEQRGVRVRILTNSLASTDVVAVHSGYRRYRPALIAAGADLYEMKPVEEKTRQRLLATSTPSHASLHSKVYIIDGKHVFIGSFNFDPRSISLNTEIALVIHSPVIAAQLREMFERSISPDISYHVGQDENGNLIWKDMRNGQDKIWRNEPDTDFWRDLQVFLISLLPVEDQL